MFQIVFISMILIVGLIWVELIEVDVFFMYVFFVRRKVLKVVFVFLERIMFNQIDNFNRIVELMCNGFLLLLVLSV